MNPESKQQAERLAAISGFPQKQILPLLYLWQEGYGNPFIARYRKEWTGGLGERELEELQETFENEEVSEKVKKDFRTGALLQGASTSMVMEFSNQASVREIEILGPLLLTLVTFSGMETVPPRSVQTGPPPPGVPLEECCSRIAVEIVRDLNFYRNLVDTARAEGEFQFSAVEGAPPLPARFSPWVGRPLPIAQVPAEAVLLGHQAEEQNLANSILHLPVDHLAIQIEEAFAELVARALGEGVGAKVLDLYLLEPIARTLKGELLDNAQKEWIAVQCKAFRDLLRQTRIASAKIAGVHPDYRSGCAVAIIDAKGTLCDQALLRPHESLKQRESSRVQLAELIRQHEISLVAIGKAPACRDMESLLREALTLLEKERKKPEQVILPEAGTPPPEGESGDAAAPLPHHIALALSVARRAQDPLAELVKTDPVSQVNSQILPAAGLEKLRRRLLRILTSQVSAAKVKLNEAPVSLLRYVCGLDETIARQIVKHRDHHRRFSTRCELMKVPGVRGRIFEQAAGFLYVAEGDNPLDNSAIHPESYFVVWDLCSRLNIPPETLLARPELLSYFQPEDFVTREVKAPTISDIFSELANR